MKHACLTARPVLKVFAAGLVSAATVSAAFSLGCAPIVGATVGAFLGLVNFASLHESGVRILNAAADQSTECIPTCKVALPHRQPTAVLGSFGVRLATVVAGMAAVARWFGVSGLLFCSGMLFAVQVPLFVSLAAVARGRASDPRLI